MYIGNGSLDSSTQSRINEIDDVQHLSIQALYLHIISISIGCSCQTVVCTQLLLHRETARRNRNQIKNNDMCAIAYWMDVGRVEFNQIPNVVFSIRISGRDAMRMNE